MFEGTLTALITPFRKGQVDEPALRALIERQIDAGIDGLVPCGSTGESATLSYAEHHRVVEITIEAAAGRVPVIAGTGSNSTREAIDITQHAKQAGADGALLLSPYSNKPTTTQPSRTRPGYRSSSTISQGARPRISCPQRSPDSHRSRTSSA